MLGPFPPALLAAGAERDKYFFEGDCGGTVFEHAEDNPDASAEDNAAASVCVVRVQIGVAREGIGPPRSPSSYPAHPSHPTRSTLLTPGRTSLRTVLGCDDTGFLDFLTCLLQIDPAKRASASQALAHPWMRTPLHFDPYIIPQ